MTEDGFRTYARERGLEFQAEEEVAPLTPFLAMGDRRWFGPVLAGRLPGGIEGRLARYRYERRSRRAVHDYEFTIVISELPETTVFVPRLVCEGRAVERDHAEPAFEMRSSRLWQESVAFSDRFRVVADPHQDQNWLRQLFSPAFLTWLTDEAPEGFSFELVYGVMCANREGDDSSPKSLDRLCETSAGVAERIRKECAE